jgi:hypothetical protein
MAVFILAAKTGRAKGLPSLFSRQGTPVQPSQWNLPSHPSMEILSPRSPATLRMFQRKSQWVIFWMCWAVSEFGNWELIWAQGERLKSKVALGMKQKIEDLKIRRRKERTNLILTAASHGDLAGFNHVFQASPIPQCDPHIWPVIHLPGSVVHVSKISRWYVICVHFRSVDLEINCSNRAEWAQWREGNVGRRVWEDSTSCCCLGRPGLPFQDKRAHHNTVANICWNILT